MTLSGASLTTENLAANTVYGIQITGTTSIGWDWTSSSATANGSSGSITGYAWGNSGGDYSKGVAYAELAVSVVPEVPMTGMFMGLGALFIVVSHRLRRKEVRRRAKRQSC